MRHKTVIVTRPLPDATLLIHALQEHGHHAIGEPLTEIFLHHTARQALTQALESDPDAVIVTSRNGARALAALTELRDLAVLCVGESTEAAARDCGFDRCFSCGGTVQAMLDYIVDAYDAGGRFVYLSAEHTRENLPEALRPFDMHVLQVVAYSAVASESLSETLTEQIRRNMIDGVVFMSQRSADIFMQLARKAQIEGDLAAMQAYCLSEACALPLRDAPWGEIVLAEQPTLASMVASVDNH